MSNRLDHLLPIVFLIIVFSALGSTSFGGDTLHPGDMTGGKVIRAVVTLPKSNLSERARYEFEVDDVFLEGKAAFDGKQIKITTFVSARAKEGAIVAWGQFGGGALINSAFQSLAASGSSELSKPLPAGKYDLVVTVIGQVEGEQSRLLDIHMVPFEVTARTTRPVER